MWSYCGHFQLHMTSLVVWSDWELAHLSVYLLNTRYNLIMTYIFLVFVFNYKLCHISLQYRYLINRRDHIRLTYFGVRRSTRKKVQNHRKNNHRQIPITKSKIAIKKHFWFSFTWLNRVDEHFFSFLIKRIC